MAQNGKRTRVKSEASKMVGVYGVNVSSGYVIDEFQRELKGKKGIKKYREMQDSDPIVGGMLFAIKWLLKRVAWGFEAAPADAGGEKAAWLKTTLETMDKITFDDLIGEALSMVTYGYAIMEVKTRARPDADGTIGLEGIFPRAQETIDRWELDKNGDILGFYQIPPNVGGQIYVPAWKCLHFTTELNRGNPEGRSMLRNAYRSYYFIDSLSVSEAIGAERNLAGLPILYAPSDTLEIPEKKAALLKIVRDIKNNEQGGLLFPSDLQTDQNGQKTAVRSYELKLLAAEGSSTVDTDKIIRRHRQDMALTLLADILLLGSDGAGSLALSKTKSELFASALEGLLKNIASTFQRQLCPLLWTLNGWDFETIPTPRPSRVAPVDLEQLSSYLTSLSGVGIMLNDEATENHLRDAGGLPPAPADALGMKDPSLENKG